MYSTEAKFTQEDTTEEIKCGSMNIRLEIKRKFNSRNVLQCSSNFIDGNCLYRE